MPAVSLPGWSYQTGIAQLSRAELLLAFAHKQASLCSLLHPLPGPWIKKEGPLRHPHPHHTAHSTLSLWSPAAAAGVDGLLDLPSPTD